MKREKIILIEVKLCNALLRMTLVCISISLKSVLKLSVVVLDTCHPVTTFMWARTWDSVVIFEAKRGPWSKRFEIHWSGGSLNLSCPVRLLCVGTSAETSYRPTSNGRVNVFRLGVSAFCRLLAAKEVGIGLHLLQLPSVAFLGAIMQKTRSTTYCAAQSLCYLCKA